MYEDYTTENESSFIKGLGKGLFYTSHELSSRINLLQNYLKSFRIRKLSPNIDRNYFIPIIEKEINMCISKGCSQRMHSIMCPGCGE